MVALSSTQKRKVTKAKKPIRNRRPRRELPEDLTDLFIAKGDSPNDLDVIAGRGGGSNHHEGNKRYWYCILQERARYKRLGTNNNGPKNKIAEAIYDYILETGGRFLQMDTKTHDWFSIPKKICLDKIKQALRDKYIPHFAKTKPQTPRISFPLPAPSGPSEMAKEQFKTFLNQAPAPAKSQTFFSTQSNDLRALLQEFDASSHSSLDSPMLSLPNAFLKSQDLGPSQKSFNEFIVPGNSLDEVCNPLGSSRAGDDWTESIRKIPSINLSFGGANSLDLMYADLITTDKMSDNVIEPPKSLQALFQRQMESAIPSSRAVFQVAV